MSAVVSTHRKGYPDTSSEVWDTNPMCTICGHGWPCDTAVVQDEVVTLLNLLISDYESQSIHPAPKWMTDRRAALLDESQEAEFGRNDPSGPK